MNGDIEQVIDIVRLRLPSAMVTQIKGVHRADDVGIWWFSLPGVKPEMHVESSSGNCPFLIETDEQSSGEALRASTVEQAGQLVTDYLNAKLVGRTIELRGERYWK
ncbi:MAG: hypothetical protein ABI273_05285 [Lacunisphaera sp.]